MSYQELSQLLASKPTGDWPAPGTISNDLVSIAGMNQFLFLYKGTNNYFDAYTQPIHQAVAQADVWLRFLEQAHTTCANLGAEFQFCMIPNKASVLPELYPIELPVSQTVRMHRLMANLQCKSANLLELFREPSFKESVFRRNDSHLTMFGNLYAVDSLVRSLGFNPKIIGPDLETYSVEHSGDLGGRFSPSVKEQVILQAKSQVIPAVTVLQNPRSGHVGLTFHVYNPEAENDCRLLVVGNSFFERYEGWGMTRFMANNFSSMVFQWNPAIDRTLLEAYRPDCVVFQTCERFMERSPDFFRSQMDFSSLYSSLALKQENSRSIQKISRSHIFSNGHQSTQDKRDGTMKFSMQTNGILTVNATVSEHMSVWVGERMIGRIGPGSNFFPWRGLVLNADLLRRYGVQLRDEKEQLSGQIDVEEFVSQYLADDMLLEKMQRLIMPGRWELYSLSLSETTVTAEFGIVFSKDALGSQVTFTCNDISASRMIVTNEPHFSQSYWFMPENCVLGYKCVFELEKLTDFLKFQLHLDSSTPSYVAYHYERPHMSYTNLDLLKPLPNIERIRRVSGVHANQNSFLNGGRTAYERIHNLISFHGFDIDDSHLRILDWGVGCGRVARYFADMENVEISGADIDEDNIGWCKENLRGDYRLVPLAPPTSFSDNTFDVIYSCSVLSHLTEEMADLWLKELVRILKPNGLALLSYNGSSNLISYLGRRPQVLRNALATEFFDGDINRDLEGFIPSSDYYRATFASSAWWNRMFCKHFHLSATEFAVVSGHQDVAVLRQKFPKAD